MSISILIPCRNYDCTDLVSHLYLQLVRLNIDFEIIIGDDKSTQPLIDISKVSNMVSEYGFNFYVDKIKTISPISTGRNPIGAGRMRNFLANNAICEYLLFLDSDVMPSDMLFISRYIDNIDINNDSVIVGGFCYQKDKPNRDFQLKYYYGHKIECKPLKYRKANPYKSFVSMNFFVTKEIYLQNQMHQKVSMGYEDALWGKMLQANNIQIHHIDNPVIHTLKETNSHFIDTTYKYVDNIRQYKEFFPTGTVKLLDMYEKLQPISPILSFLSKQISKPIETYLIHHPKNIKLLQLLKLLRLYNN